VGSGARPGTAPHVGRTMAPRGSHDTRVALSQPGRGTAGRVGGPNQVDGSSQDSTTIRHQAPIALRSGRRRGCEWRRTSAFSGIVTVRDPVATSQEGTVAIRAVSRRNEKQGAGTGRLEHRRDLQQDAAVPIERSVHGRTIRDLTGVIQEVPKEPISNLQIGPKDRESSRKGSRGASSQRPGCR